MGFERSGFQLITRLAGKTWRARASGVIAAVYSDRGEPSFFKS